MRSRSLVSPFRACTPVAKSEGGILKIRRRVAEKFHGRAHTRVRTNLNVGAASFSTANARKLALSRRSFRGIWEKTNRRNQWPKSRGNRCEPRTVLDRGNISGISQIVGAVVVTLEPFKPIKQIQHSFVRAVRPRRIESLQLYLEGIQLRVSAEFGALRF